MIKFTIEELKTIIAKDKLGLKLTQDESYILNSTKKIQKLIR